LSQVAFLAFLRLAFVAASAFCADLPQGSEQSADSAQRCKPGRQIA
jgi:hypothetical protein